MKIAVTGASGHVGINLCNSLSEQGHVVKALFHTHNSVLKELKVEEILAQVVEECRLRRFRQLGSLTFDGVYGTVSAVQLKGTGDQ